MPLRAMLFVMPLHVTVTVRDEIPDPEATVTSTGTSFEVPGIHSVADPEVPLPLAVFAIFSSQYGIAFASSSMLRMLLKFLTDPSPGTPPEITCS